jgi:hypothetical protein
MNRHILTIVLLLVGVSAQAQTKINLATQVKGTLPNSNLVSSGQIVVNTAGPLGGGATVALGGTLNLTCTGCLNAAVTSVSGTAPITVATGTTTPVVACPTCLTGPDITLVGGIMGGYANASASNGLAFTPWAGSGVNSTNVPNAFNSWFRNLAVVNSAASSAGEVHSVYFQSTFAAVATNPLNMVVVSLPSSVAAGVYGSVAGSSPWPAAQLAASYAYMKGVNGNTLAIRGYSWDVIGSTSQPIGWYTGSNSIATGATNFGGPSQPTAWVAAASEALQGVIVPYASTARNLCAQTNAAQPATGTLVIDLRKTTAGVTSSPGLTLTIPVSGSGAPYCNTTSSVGLAAGDWIDFQGVNNAGTASATVYAITMELVPSGAATGMIAWGLRGLAFASSAAQYAAPFSAAALSATEANQRAPMPRAVTMKNLSCLYTTPPGSNPIVVTVVKNGTPDALTVSIPTSGVGTQIITDSTHTVSFAALDTFDLKFLQSSGTNPVISSCSVEVD